MQPKLYTEVPLLEILSGDTLPTFTISVETVDDTGNPIPADISGCTMQLIVAKEGSSAEAVLTKDCTPAADGFSVTLTSTDTANLYGMYQYHLTLYAENSLIYRKLMGQLYVRPAAKSGTPSGENPDSSADTQDVRLTQHLADTTVHITMQERQNWNAATTRLEALQTQLTPRATAFSKTIYADAVNGSDDGEGTSASPYKTIEKAIAEAVKNRHCIVNLAAGTYETAAAIDIRGTVSLSIRGAATDTTVVNGRFSIGRGAYCSLQNLTISGETTTSNGSLFVWEGATVYVTACTFQPFGGYGVNLSTFSNVCAASCIFSGTPSRAARANMGSRLLLRACTDITGTGCLCQQSGQMHIDTSTGVTYSASTAGMVWVDGKQVLPE